MSPLSTTAVPTTPIEDAVTAPPPDTVKPPAPVALSKIPHVGSVRLAPPVTETPGMTAGFFPVASGAEFKVKMQPVLWPLVDTARALTVIAFRPNSLIKNVGWL